MKSIDTIKLLQECDAGTKMAVASIDNMLDKVGSQQLKNVLEESKSHHESLGNQIHDMLNEREAFEKAGGSTGTVSGIGAHCKAEHVDPECGYHDNR